MSDTGRHGFLSRWSQRKLQARESSPVTEEREAEQPVATPDASQAAGGETRLLADRPSAQLAPGEPGASPDVRPDAAASGTVSGCEKTLPDLEDVRLLTPESDFSPFMARGVAPAVKNAAMKKLFADPHFNVMDGLDIYIDDYTRREVLPESMMRKMASSKFLNMFPEEAEVAAQGGDAVSEAASDPAGADAGEDMPATGPVQDDEAQDGDAEHPDGSAADVVSSAHSAQTDLPETGVSPPLQETGPQEAPSLGVSTGLPTAFAQVHNGPEASRTFMIESERQLGDALSDEPPFERINRSR